MLMRVPGGQDHDDRLPANGFNRPPERGVVSMHRRVVTIVTTACTLATVPVHFVMAREMLADAPGTLIVMSPASGPSSKSALLSTACRIPSKPQNASVMRAYCWFFYFLFSCANLILNLVFSNDILLTSQVCRHQTPS